MNKRTNKKLKKLYDQVYKKGKNKFFTFDSDYITKQVIRAVGYKNKRVLEIGCGTGKTAFAIAKKGGKVLAIDYSEESIKIAKKQKHKNLVYSVAEYQDISDTFDIILLQEVLEHLENPLSHLKNIKKKLKKKGKLIITCPSFMNIRGYVWMTLLLLFDVPMSLSDINYFCPFDFIEFAKKLNMKLKWKTINFDWGNNEKMIIDFKKRIPNALRDAKMKGNVAALLSWLEKVSQFDHKNKFSGVTGLYVFEKR